jgi:hypothetical protein
MGLFKDLGDTKRAAKELSANSPGVGARLADMNQKMATLTSTLEASNAALATPSADARPAEIQVVSAEGPTGYINGDPIVTVSVLVLLGGAPPVPATQSIVVPALHLHRLSPGGRLAGRVDPHDVAAFVVDWNATV